METKKWEKFIKSLMVEGATVDWREDLQNKLGEPMSARAMAAYFCTFNGIFKRAE